MKNIVLKNRIDELIKACPSNWAELVAEKINITPDAVHKRINNVQNTILIIEVIEALKIIKADHEELIKKALK